MLLKCLLLFICACGILVEGQESRPFCYGEGEIDCKEAVTCKEGEFKDIRLGLGGCCHKCVQILGKETFPQIFKCFHTSFLSF